MEVIILIYARARVGHLMGRGPSPSEVAELYFMVILFAGIAGIIASLGMTTFWLIRMSLTTKSSKAPSNSNRTIQSGILITPMFFALAVAVVTAFFISYHYTIP
jgi:hypothetical protein